ncbi:hypothetical protein [Archangium violaceum]|uniref:hypothetical protein n=1 Tax=Archangium violaceum TaxID=83451 RepID=UPI0036DF3121
MSRVSEVVHRYSPDAGANKVDVDIAIPPSRARFVKYSEPSDSEWNGWGTFFQFRAYTGSRR